MGMGCWLHVVGTPWIRHGSPKTPLCSFFYIPSPNLAHNLFLKTAERPAGGRTWTSPSVLGTTVLYWDAVLVVLRETCKQLTSCLNHLFLSSWRCCRVCGKHFIYPDSLICELLHKVLLKLSFLPWLFLQSYCLWISLLAELDLFCTWFLFLLLIEGS